MQASCAGSPCPYVIWVLRLLFLAGEPVYDWQVFPLELKDISAVSYTTLLQNLMPAASRAQRQALQQSAADKDGPVIYR